MNDGALEAYEAEIRRRLARNVKAMRQERKLSVQAIAKLAGIHWRHWQKVEDEDVNAKVSTVTKLARVLDVDPTELLEEATPAPRSKKRS